MAEKGRKHSFLKTLRGRLTLQMLLVSLVPILVIGCLVYTSMRNSERKASDKVDNTSAALEEDVIGQNLIDVTAGFMGQVITGQAATVYNLAIAPEVVGAAESVSATNPEADEFLKDVITRSQFKHAAITDTEGDVVAGAYQGTAGPQGGTAGLPASLKDGEAWQAAMEHGVNVGHPIYFAATAMFEIDFAARIDDSGQAVGVLQCAMSGPASLVGPIFTGRISGGKALMFDEDTGDLLIDTSDFTRHTQASPELSELEQAVQTAIVDTKDNNGYFNMDGDVAVFVRVSSLTQLTYSSGFLSGFQSCSWAVVVEQPEDVAFAGLQPMTTLKSDLRDSTNNMVITLGIILLVVLVWVLVMGFLLSRSITKPVTELRDAAEKISMGDMSVDIPAAGDDEIGDLSESFGRMVAAMRFLYEEEKERGRS